MFNKKLKEEINNLKEMHKSLSSRISVLEFERDNGGKTYRIQLARGHGFNKHTWIEYLNEHKTKVIEMIKHHGNFDYYTQNGKYLEFREFGCLKRAYEIKGDDLVEIDINLYKAWLELEKDNKEKVFKLMRENSEKILNALKDGSKGVCYINTSKSNEEMIKEIKEQKCTTINSNVSNDNVTYHKLEATEDSGEVKQTKKLGDKKCDDYMCCDDCPLYPLSCSGCWEGNLYEVLKHTCSNPDTGEIEDKFSQDLYDLFKARLDKNQ